MRPQDRLIFPLDVPRLSQALDLVRQLKDDVGLFKIGLELFVAEGPHLLGVLGRETAADFFLDLKFHDIPETVRRAVECLPPRVRFATVHCEPGCGLQAAAAAAATRGVALLGVTVLTSLDTAALLAAGIAPDLAASPRELVLRRAALAHSAGCAGVVCAGPEARAVKEAFGPDFLVVCPGIRPAWAKVPGDDQKRLMSPGEAVGAGADYLVVGRPIRQAPDPAAAARQIVAEIAAA